MIWLIFAHFIGDWGLQSPWMAENKGKYWEVMFAHCAIYTALICIALQYLGIYAIWKVVPLMLSHYAVDSWKCDTFITIEKHRWTLWVDHIAHFSLLIVVNFVR